MVPLLWYPRLWHGTPEERGRFEIFGDGAYIHWPDLDEDLTVRGLLVGRRSLESPASLKRWLAARKVGSEEARRFCQTFFQWYNREHRHSGLGLLTPETVHAGREDPGVCRPPADAGRCLRRPP